MSSPVAFEPILRAVLQTEGGKDFLRWLLIDICGCLRSPMAGTGHDIQYLCGKQDVGYLLLELLLATQPQILATLMEVPDAST